LEVKTPPSSVSASLCSVTSCDQRRRLAVLVRRARAGFLRRMFVCGRARAPFGRGRFSGHDAHLLENIVSEC
jgi:hypothetical protein